MEDPKILTLDPPPLSDSSPKENIGPSPSFKEQLYERRDCDAATLAESYLESCRRAPHASEDTKRKWRRALGIR